METKNAENSQKYLGGYPAFVLSLRVRDFPANCIRACYIGVRPTRTAIKN